MTIKKKPKQRHEHLEKVLSDLFYNKQFIEKIKLLRKEAGIPENGYETFLEYYDHMKRDSEDKARNRYFIIDPGTIKLAVEYKLPYSLYSYWIEAFLALDFNYKDFCVNIPYNSPRDYFVYGINTTLDTSEMRDGRMSLHIFPGASLNSAKDFLQENWGFINAMLETYSQRGKAPVVRERNKRDRAKILELAERKELSNTGVWVPGKGMSRAERANAIPDCIKGLGTDQIKKIIAEEKRKKKIREHK